MNSGKPHFFERLMLRNLLGRESIHLKANRLSSIAIACRTWSIAGLFAVFGSERSSQIHPSELTESNTPAHHTRLFSSTAIAPACARTV